MPLLRLLSASLLASTFLLCAPAVARGQTPSPTPAPPVITAPPIFPTPLSPLSAIKPYAFKFDAPKTLPKPTLSAQTRTLCYTLRAYGFTARDLQSPNPRASSYTECTPASNSNLKAAKVVIVK